ncbi:MAG: MotA/TolQ/ExbB proton channel family protein, partial [Pseudomonadota bacterium]
NIATLMGLLGTVMGLIAAFTAIGAAEGGSKADLLSSSISVAMNTTAFGLICAIPLLVAHTLLMSKTQKVVGLLEVASLKSANTFAPLLNRKTSVNESENVSLMEQA